MEIWISCDDNDSLNSWTKKKYLLKADHRMGLGVFKDIRDAVGEKGYILNIQPSERGLNHGSRWTGFWHIDVQLEGKQFPRVYGEVDTVFVASTARVADYNKPTRLLFQAADPLLDYRRRYVEEKFDFTLSGTFGSGFDVYKERDRRTKIMKDNFSHWDYGKGFPPHEYIEKLSTARVQWIQSGVNRNGEGMCAQRFFESMAIGPVLCNWCRDLEHTGFVEGRDYLAYRSDNEMVEKMKMLLMDPEMRRIIAYNGRSKTLMYHTYDNRIGSIINAAMEDQRT